MEKQFRIKTNLWKAGEAFLMGAIPAATVCLTDALAQGELDLKKVKIGLGLSVTLAGLKSVQNYLKNKPRGKRGRRA